MSQLISPPGLVATGTGLEDIYDTVAGFAAAGLDALFLGEEVAIGAPYGTTLSDATANHRHAALAAAPPPNRSAAGLVATTAAGFGFKLPAGYWPANFTVALAGQNVGAAVIPSFAFCGMRLTANWTGANLAVGVFGGAGNVLRTVAHPTAPKNTPFAMAVSVNGATNQVRIKTSWGQYEATENDLVNTIQLYRDNAVRWEVQATREAGDATGNVLGPVVFKAGVSTMAEMDALLTAIRRRMREERGVGLL